jgi:hypothetical protein
MATTRERVLELLIESGGLSDREITDVLISKDAGQQPINQICRDLEHQGMIIRSKVNGRIRNYLANNSSKPIVGLQERKEFVESDQAFSEDTLKKHLEEWLILNGWMLQVAWGHAQGIDICATQGNKRWVIEVKGGGSRPPMRVNYFLMILGETLQRMDDIESDYSIALPDLQQFRNLWNRLPQLAKRRTGISILFVDRDGKITQSTN